MSGQSGRSRAEPSESINNAFTLFPPFASPNWTSELLDVSQDQKDSHSQSPHVMEESAGDGESQGGGSLFKRACDHCRSRKVKCDKLQPCSACKASNLPCNTTERREAPKRKRIHVSDDYERKIDLIEEKLAKIASLDRIIQSSPLLQLSAQSPKDTTQQLASNSNSSIDTSRHRTLFADEDQPDAERNAYEGETSLNAHSIQARALVERVLGQGSFAATSTEVSSAISDLKDMANGSKKPASSPAPHNAKVPQAGGFDHRKLPLPPVSVVLDILRKCRDDESVVHFDLPFNWITRARLTEFCRAIFFSVDDYPISTAIIVFANLFLILTEFTLKAKDPLEKAQHKQWADFCKNNFEACVSNLDILMPATSENIEALLLGAAHGIETAKLNVSWKLIAIALTLIQTLGWHRASSIAKDDQETAQRKTKIFWFFYMLDKGLSLRLGRASKFLDYDIDLPYPILGNDTLGKNATEFWRISLNVYRVQGLIYEQLYSPGALRQSQTVRTQRAYMLVNELSMLQAQEMEIAKATFGTRDPNAEFTFDMAGVFTIFELSDVVNHYTNITMCYRGIPSNTDPSGVSPECLSSARDAMDSHMKALRLKDTDPIIWNGYLTWTIVFAPFIPFLVIFNNVLATADTRDLIRLKDFVESISDCEVGEGARKVHHICNMFYRIAYLYVEARLSKQVTEAPLPPKPSPPKADSGTACDLSALNPYLNAVGFTGDPMVDLSTDINNDVGDWFNGNQFVIGLMDSDFYAMGGTSQQVMQPGNGSGNGFG